jgi:hypothetical protein
MEGNFYGDNNRIVVHDLSNEKSECDISEIMIVHKRYFIPDTFEQAKSEGFINCEYCIKIDKPKLDTKKEFEESNKARDRIVFKDKIEEQIEEQKIRIKALKADRRSGGSKAESKIKKSKARTKEVRSSKKIATVRKRRN